MTSSEPDPPSINPRLYTTEGLERIAVEFLRLYHKPPESLPIDIELIIERDLEISIMPFSALKLVHGIEAFITLSRRTIYMDPFLMDLDQNERRYRFTLAEEVAHWLIHKDLFKGVQTPDDYIALYDQLHPKYYRRMDKNAKYLASAILMPANLFEVKATEIFQKITESQTKPLPSVHLRVIEQLADLFQVSQLSTGIRFQQRGLDRRLRLD